MANDRDCENCKHHKKMVCKDGIFYHSCELWDCEFEPKEDEPLELCEDAISRKSVLDTLENMDRALDEDRTVENYKELLRECYKVLPSVNPQKPCKDCQYKEWLEGEDLPPVTPQKPKSEWQHDHEILKAYSDGASAVLDNVRAEIDEEYDRVHPYDILIAEGLERALDIIDKYAEEDKA